MKSAGRLNRLHRTSACDNRRMTIPPTRPRCRSRPAPPLAALHAPLRLRRDRRPGDRARRRRLHLGRPRKRYLDGLAGPVRGPGRPRPRGTRRGRRAADEAARVLPAVGRTRTRRRSSWPSGWPTRAPGDLNRVFFTVSGGESVETAWKLAKQYFKLVGKPTKHKVISRSLAYHGTSQGALSITGIPGAKADFEPLVPSTLQGARTPTSTARPSTPTTTRRTAAGPRTRSSRPSSSRAPTRSPRCSSSRCRTPAAASRRRPATSQRVREICDKHDVLLVSDEVICAFGRARPRLRRQALRLPARHHHHGEGPDVRLRAAGRGARSATG